MLMVSLVKEAGAKVTHPLEPGVIHVVGRGSEVDIQIRDASVSRTHAEFYEAKDGRWWVRDLGSSNHTYLNGVQTEAAVIKAGDAIRFGDFTVKIESTEREPQFQWSASGRLRDPKVTD